MIAQGSDEINIIVGVASEDFERAIKAIYGAFSDGDHILELSELHAAREAARVDVTNILKGGAAE